MNNSKKTNKKTKIFFSLLSEKVWPILLPFLVVIAFLVVLPLIGIVIFSVIKPTGNNIMFEITFERFVRLFTNQNLMISILYSLLFALIASFITVLMAYPIALIMASLKNKHLAKNMWLLFTMPIWISAILKILGLQSLFYTIAPWALGTPIAIIIGMVYMFLPFAISPIYNSLADFDKSYVDAALDLGASKNRAFWQITFRQSLPGVLTGFTLVLVQAATSLLIIKYMGNGKINLISSVIESYFFRGSDFGFGAAISVVLACLIFFLIMISKLISSKLEFRRSKKWKSS